MNLKQLIIMIVALVISVLILRHDLPIEFPGVIFKVMMLFVKLFAVFVLTIFAYIFAGGKNKSS